MTDERRHEPDSAEDRQALRTAYAFGELDATEAARVETEMRADPASPPVLEELRQLRDVLLESQVGVVRPAASDALRQQILARLEEPVQLKKPVNGARRWWNGRRGVSLTFAGVTAVGLLLILMPMLQLRNGSRMAKRTKFVMGDGSVLLESQPMSEREFRLQNLVAEGSDSADASGGAIEIGESMTQKTSPHSGGYWGAGVHTATHGYVPAGSAPADLGAAREARNSSQADTSRGRDAPTVFHGSSGSPIATGSQSARQYSAAGRAQLGESLRRRTDDYGLRFTPAAGGEQYEALPENELLPVRQEPVSTFSIDVDTASYANVRRFLTQGRLPPPQAVRIEELINYFPYHDRGPEPGEPFGVTMEVAECPWRPEHQLVRIALKGKLIPQESRPPCNLVFLIDVSGSMRPANKLPLLQQAMKLLTDQLTEIDRVAIVTYAGNAGLALDSIPGHRHAQIKRTIDSLQSGGSTHGSAGIQLAYQKAEQYFQEEGVNRVILATDGDLNVGVTQDDALVRLIKSKAKSGIFLTVLGVGEGNLKDAKLEKLADNGNGIYAYLDNLREARKVLVEQAAGSLVTIAKDVKIKVEFNPAQVHAYRLIGYENRMMSAPEFDDDRKDAGEIGAGHSVTALYEIAAAATQHTVARAAPGLKYQQPAESLRPPLELTEAAGSGELLTLSLRYKRPDGGQSTLREFALRQREQSFSSASRDFRFASAVAAFGMLLRGSRYGEHATFAAVERTAAEALGEDLGGYRTEFLELVRRAAQLSGR